LVTRVENAAEEGDSEKEKNNENEKKRWTDH
jgi:hypothetical protein